MSIFAQQNRPSIFKPSIFFLLYNTAMCIESFVHWCCLHGIFTCVCVIHRAISSPNLKHDAQHSDSTKTLQHLLKENYQVWQINQKQNCKKTLKKSSWGSLCEKEMYLFAKTINATWSSDVRVARQTSSQHFQIIRDVIPTVCQKILCAGMGTIFFLRSQEDICHSQSDPNAAHKHLKHWCNTRVSSKAFDGALSLPRYQSYRPIKQSSCCICIPLIGLCSRAYAYQ